MKKLDRRIIIIAALIFIIGLAYGLMQFLIAQKEEPPMRPPREVKRYVKAEPVKYDTIMSPTTASGRLYSVAEVDLVAEASGKIQQGNISLKKGAEFSKGDVLFTVYPDEVALALKASKSKFLNSLVNILPEIAIDFPKQEQKFRSFFASINLDKKLPDFPLISDEKFKVFLASRNLLNEYYIIVKDELKLSRHTVYAPFIGTYTQVNLEVGAYTNTGGKVARAIRTDALELEVPVERADADWIKVGDEVKVISDKTKITRTGVVARKNKFIRLKNHKSSPFLTGEFLTAIFPGHPINDVMKVPRNVVFNTNEVFVIEENRLRKKKVNIIKIAKETLVFDGIPEGDILVMQPLINVLEGTKVEIQGQETGQRKQKPGNEIEKKKD